MINSVLSTPGGKKLMREIITSNFHDHDCYIEPFGGALHILLAKQPSNLEVVNDLDSDIVAFFKTLRDNYEDFLFHIEYTPCSRKLFNDMLKMNPADDFERAYRFYILNKLCFAGKRVGQTFWCGTERPPSLHRSDKLWPIIKRMQNVIIECLDFRQIINKYNDKNVFMYCDPPYVGSEHQYNTQHEFSIRDHNDLYQLLNNYKGKWMLSYNDTEFIRSLYADFYIKEIKGLYEHINLKRDGDSRIQRKELIITNYNLETIKFPLFKGLRED